MPFRLPRVPILVLCLALPGVLPLSAQNPQQRVSLYDKFQVNLSVTSVILNANIRVDGSGGQGTDIDAEDDLGLEQTKIQPRAALRWKPGRRHEIEVGYQFARREANKRLERDIEFGDSTYNLGADIKATFNTDQAFLTYRFAFMAKERTQIGFALGLGALFLDTGLEAQGTGSDPRKFAVEKSLTGPLGSIGFFGRFLAGERWYFEADARAVKIEIDRFHPQVVEFGAGVRYFLSQSVGLDFGYAASAIKVDVDPRTRLTGEEGPFSGRIKYSLQSIRLGVVIVP